MSVFKRRGFQAYREEQKRREAAQEAKRGRLFDYYLKDDDPPDAPIRFLTEEPVLWYRHRIKVGNQFVNEVCKGEDCPYCEDGNRASYVGTWLVVDGREFEVDERKDGRKTGKKIIVKDRLKLFTRGSTDIAKLEQKSRKYGLTSRPWFVTKTGSGQSTSYELDRGEPDKLTTKQIDKLMEQLPDRYRKLYRSGDPESLYEIVEAQIFGLPDEEDDEDDRPARRSRPAYDDDDVEDDEYDDEEPDIDSGVQSLDDEDEDDDEDDEDAEEKSARKPRIKPQSKFAPASKNSAPKKKLKLPIRRK